MWDQCTQLALRAVYFAREEAARGGENYVGTEHLLLGLLREEDNVAVRVLAQLNMSPEGLRSDIERQLVRWRGRAHTEQRIQLSIQGYKATVLALEETQLLGHKLTGTGHLLLGLIRHGGIAAGLLMPRGAELEQARQKVAKIQDEENQRSFSEL